MGYFETPAVDWISAKRLQQLRLFSIFALIPMMVVPIILNDISYEDSYQGDFQARRAIIYTMSFTSKFFLYGPVTSSKVIKTVQVDQYTDMPTAAPKREQRYTVTPNPTTATADDDFGFNETTSFFQDAKNFDEESGEDKLNQE